MCSRLSTNLFSPFQVEERFRLRKQRDVSLLPCTEDCGQGEGMDTRDKVASLVGYQLFVAMAIAVIAAVMAH